MIIWSVFNLFRPFRLLAVVSMLEKLLGREVYFVQMTRLQEVGVQRVLQRSLMNACPNTLLRN